MTAPGAPSHASAPAPLVVAAALAGLEGGVLVVLGVLELANVTTGRLTMGLTTALFFAAYGVLLLSCAVLATRGRTWTRGPILMAQLIQLGLAWNLRSGETTLVAAAIAVVAVVVIAGMIHPASIAALERERDA